MLKFFLKNNVVENLGEDVFSHPVCEAVRHFIFGFNVLVYFIINVALVINNFRVGAAAQILNLSPAGLYRSQRFLRAVAFGPED